MKRVTHIIQGKNGRIWFIESGDRCIWVSDPRNETGSYGDLVKFVLDNDAGQFLQWIARGPWLSNPKALYEDTGFAEPTNLGSVKLEELEGFIIPGVAWEQLPKGAHVELNPKTGQVRLWRIK